MLWFAAVLFGLWLLGLATSNTLGGFLHILLVVSVAVLVIQETMGQRKTVAYSARRNRAGKVTTAQISSSTPSTAIPTIRNGSSRSQTKG